jgi:predicted GTPase
MAKQKVLILGAAGRDFHNFNMCYRNNPMVQVVGFTATQIPDIADRRYPAALAGPLYPEGIAIYPEAELPRLIPELGVDACLFSYSDVSNQHVMELSAEVHAAGADFVLPGPARTQIRCKKPVVSVGAVRTGCGKSQTARRIIDILMGRGRRVVAIRHPMPYGDLALQAVQRFASLSDLDHHHCTVEEMEEYEPHIARGNVIYAGVDYEAIVQAAEKDPKGCDILLWDGGNNDLPFLKPDLHITVCDPHRPGHERTYYPGTANLKMAQVVVINKVDSANGADIDTVRRHVAALNPTAVVVDAASPLVVEDPDIIRGKRVLVVEDGPTLTHGEMKIGAGTLAARKFGAAALVDPKPFAVGRIADTFQRYPETGCLLPAMGYGPAQLRDLEATIAKTPCDAVVVGTPIDLKRILRIARPSTRVFYSLQEIGKPDLEEVLSRCSALLP